MKYLKLYESNDNKILDNFCDFLKNFIKGKLNKIIYINKYNNYKYNFYYDDDYSRPRKIFDIIIIDYFYDDIDRFFQFNIFDKIDTINYNLNDEIINIITIINDIIKRYSKNQNMIKFVDIPIIIETIYSEYNVLSNIKKYNL